MRDDVDRSTGSSPTLHRRLLLRDAQLAALLEGAPVALFVVGADERIEEVRGRRVTELLGEDADGRRLDELTGAAPDLLADCRRALGGHNLDTLVDVGGGRFALTYRRVVDEAGPAAVVVAAHDVTDQRRWEHDVSQLAYADPVTGLANRRGLTERLERDLAVTSYTGQPPALVWADLDHFKVVNDRLGHVGGDQLLLFVARRLRAVAAHHGDFLARYGGDEFALLLTRRDEDIRAAAEQAAEAILAVMEAPFTVAEETFQLGASIGIAVQEDGESVADLVRRADTAMYRAKRAGRGSWAVHSHSDDDDREDRLTLTLRLRRALARDEFVLHYQPVVDLGTGETVGVEALMRWAAPERAGLVPPGEFIPQAEETGLIDDLGAWALREACAQADRWRRQGLHPGVAVNVSPLQLRRPGFAELVRTILEEEGVGAEQLTVEVIESQALQDPAATELTLAALGALGVHLAIDDFGIAYSSLSRLRELSVDVLKLDRSFLVGVPEDPQACSIVLACTALAAALGCDVVAEGVETAAQRDFLATHGCQLAQGYALGRPMPPAAITAWLREARSRR
jgi:diguanylate cyclase (GGDEF)-like protein